MLIDTGAPDDRPRPKAADLDGLGVSYARRGEHAERHSRQIVAAIYACESAADLDEYVDAEAPIVAALDRSHPHFADMIREAAEDARPCLPATNSA